jgi:glycosyltransferase involved in cell wall biosynthesis
MQSVRYEGGRALTPQSEQPMPLLSIITVVFRDRDELSLLIANLTPFRSSEVELVIIDGGSNDGSLNVLQQHNADLDFWVSEPDSGVYDAMNKGISAARGKWILHINAGDRLLDLPLQTLHGLQDDADILCCRVECDTFIWIPRVNWTFRFQNLWQHQGTFYRRETHTGYDISYRVWADFAVNQRMVYEGRRVRTSDLVVARHQDGGLSSQRQWRHEEARSIRENYGRLHEMFFRFAFKPAQHVYHSLAKWRAQLKARAARPVHKSS